MNVTSTDKKLAELILESYRRGFSVQSDYARTNASYVAMAASIGLVSTKLYGNVFSREWRPTIRGLQWLEDTFGIHIDPEEDLDDGHD